MQTSQYKMNEVQVNKLYSNIFPDETDSLNITCSWLFLMSLFMEAYQGDLGKSMVVWG